MNTNKTKENVFLIRVHSWPKGFRRPVNSTATANPHQPSNPPKEVWWGEGSFDEMGSMTLQVTAVREEDQAMLQSALKLAGGKAIMAAAADGTLKRLKLGPQ